MVQRRPVLVLVFVCATLVAALTLLPSLSKDPKGGAQASALAPAPPYGRLIIQEHGINARIRSHQIGVNNPGSGKATFGPIAVVKSIDDGTTALFEDVAAGIHLPQVVVRVFKPDTTDERVTYTLEDVLVTDFQHGGAAESLSFTYGKITIEAAGNSFCFDVALNKFC